MISFAIKLFDLIKDFNLEVNLIFFYIFSNNGSFMYIEIIKVLILFGNKYKNL